MAQQPTVDVRHLVRRVVVPHEVHVETYVRGASLGAIYDAAEKVDRSMRAGGAFVRRRAEAGDPNFVRMLEEMGGMERYERRQRWWLESRRDFVRALE